MRTDAAKPIWGDESCRTTVRLVSERWLLLASNLQRWLIGKAETRSARSSPPWQLGPTCSAHKRYRWRNQDERKDAMDLRHFRYVVAAARNGSFSAAGHELNVRQPIISKRIRALEDELGVFLFDRATSSARLTPTGEEFVVGAGASSRGFNGCPNGPRPAPPARPVGLSLGSIGQCLQVASGPR